ncbi:MAG: hypothetical protein ACOC0P_04440 [Planctomycetota bacterium]
MAEKRPGSELDKRLQEMHTSQMTESSVNVEFVEWLKKWGLNILLVVLVILVAIRGYFWLQDSREAERNALWAEYTLRDIPSSLVDLADEAGDVGSVAELSLRKAARTHYNTLIRQESLAAAVDTTEVADGEGADDDTTEGEENADETGAEEADLQLMSAEERADLINQLDSLYTRIYEMTEGDERKYLIRWEAMMSLAAVAEMRGDAEAATDWYSRLESQVESRNAQIARFDPWLREIDRRQASLNEVLRPLKLPRAEVTANGGAATGEEAALEELRRQLMDQTGEGMQELGPLGPAGPMPDNEPQADPIIDSAGDDAADGEGAANDNDGSGSDAGNNGAGGGG